VFRIGRNTFYNQKNKILMNIPEFKRSRIGLIMEFCRIPNGFPNQARKHLHIGVLLCAVLVHITQANATAAATVMATAMGMAIARATATAMVTASQWQR
jgi:hypothetical protein